MPALGLAQIPPPDQLAFTDRVNTVANLQARLVALGVPFAPGYIKFQLWYILAVDGRGTAAGYFPLIPPALPVPLPAAMIGWVPPMPAAPPPPVIPAPPPPPRESWQSHPPTALLPSREASYVLANVVHH